MATTASTASAAAASPTPKAQLTPDEESILDYVGSHAKGVRSDLVAIALSMDASLVMPAANRLLKLGRLEVFMMKNEKLPYFRVPVVTAASEKFAGMTVSERLVYQLIEKAGNKGVWIRDLRFQSNLDLKELNKILKTMEGRKLIKAVNAVVAAKKKMYMLFELEPDRSITGGKWYSEDQDFDAEFVSMLHALCYKFLLERSNHAFETVTDNPVHRRRRCFATARDICEYVGKAKVSNVALEEGDLEAILDTLVQSNKVDTEYDAVNEVLLYKACRYPEIRGGFVETPCGVCPVFHVCEDGNVVSPQSCVYLKEWMS